MTATGQHPGATSTCIESVCPAGKTSLGGGGFFAAGIELDNSRALADDSWGLCGYSDAPRDWIAQAVCVEDTVELARESVEVLAAAPAFSSTCVTASCPAGKKLVGGGGFFANTLDLDVIRPLDDQTFAVCGYAETEATQYAAQAICADIPDDDYLIERVVGQHPGQTSACVQAECPAGFVAVGGGGRWEIGSGMEPDNTGIDAGRFAVCGWSDQPSEIEVDVICVRQ